MDSCERDNVFSAARIYDAVTRLYSAVPYKHFKGGYAFPAWHFYLEMTRRCNLRCKMCQYVDWLENTPKAEQKVGELSTEEWLGVIDQLPRLSLATFTGGEPTVRGDFLELLARASTRTRTHVITNGTTLREKNVSAMVDLAPRRLGFGGLNFLGTSIEGPGERHDAIRRLDGAFERSMAGMRAVRDARDKVGKQWPMLHATTVIRDENVDVLHELTAMLKEGGIDVMNLVTETRMHDLPDLGEVDPATFKTEDVNWPRIDRAQLTEALDRTVATAREVGIGLRMPRMPREDVIDYYDEGVGLGEYECRNAWNTLIIGRQGNAYPCWIARVGNVRENTIKEIWNGAEMRAFRKTCQKHLFAMCPGCCFLEHKSRRTAT